MMLLVCLCVIMDTSDTCWLGRLCESGVFWYGQADRCWGGNATLRLFWCNAKEIKVILEHGLACRLGCRPSAAGVAQVGDL